MMPILSQATYINSSHPSAVYMRKSPGSALLQIMVCRLFGTMPLSKPMLGFYQLDHKEKKHSNFNQNTKPFIHENASEKRRPFSPGGDELIERFSHVTPSFTIRMEILKAVGLNIKYVGILYIHCPFKNDKIEENANNRQVVAINKHAKIPQLFMPRDQFGSAWCTQKHLWTNSFIYRVGKIQSWSEYYWT